MGTLSLIPVEKHYFPNFTHICKTLSHICVFLTNLWLLVWTGTKYWQIKHLTCSVVEQSNTLDTSRGTICPNFSPYVGNVRMFLYRDKKQWYSFPKTNILLCISRATLSLPIWSRCWRPPFFWWTFLQRVNFKQGDQIRRIIFAYWVAVYYG
jgi:hypothetical protein